MATVTGDFSIDFSEVADANPYSNPDFIPLQSSQARVVSGALRSVDGSTPGIFMLDPDVYVPGSVITAKIEVSDVGSGFDSLTCGVIDESGNGYRIHVNTWGVGRWRMDAWTQHNDSGEGDYFTPDNGDTFEVEYNKGTGSLVVRRNGSPLALLALTNGTHADKNLAPYFGAEPSDNGAGGIISFAADGVTAASGGATISSPTPTGTIGTATSATVGCTTDTEEGDLYVVLSETDNVSTATDEQIAAGQNSSSTAADFADDAEIEDDSPSVPFTEVLDPDTTYYYAMVQETEEGYSNVLSGSFKTAAAAVVATKLLFSAQPGNTVVGQVMSAVQVAAVNNSDVLDTDFDDNVTIALQTGDGPFLGTLTKAAVGGLATFDDLVPRTLNEDAVLRATADDLTHVDSTEFDITAGAGGGASGFPSSSRLGGVLQ